MQSEQLYIGTTQRKAQGRDRLQELAKCYKAEYEKLTLEEKDQLVAEMEKVKTTKAKGYRISARAKVNDVTQSVAAIENEVSHG